MKKGILLIILLSSFAFASIAQLPPISHCATNNINATILGDGSCYLSQSYEEGEIASCPTWEVPAGSGKQTIFQHSLWFGGLDADDTLHLAAYRFSQLGNDYWSGPLKTTDASTDLMTVLQYHHVWTLTREQINYFIAHHGEAGYEAPEDILTWPAHGEGDYAQNLAPFVDVDGNGHYNPEAGDYPDIKGDQCLFFIFNDSFMEHGESYGKKIGLEVHAMVYAYNAPDDEALNNTVFVNYKFYNRSNSNYHDVYLGLWTDWDIGYGWDDYVGCDVQRNSCFGYNGLPEDGAGEPNTYGDNPPVQVLTVLAGPYTDANERLGMTGFMYHNNYSGINGDPNQPEDYYNYMQGLWKNGQPMHYGGDGYSSGTLDLPCKYMFPGDSDPDNIGTNGIQPEGYGTNGVYWTEEQCGNAPNDRRGLAMIGPFSFSAGNIQEVDYAMITVWKNENLSAMERKGEFIDHIQTLFNNSLAK
jgi:hypothetical protein